MKYRKFMKRRQLLRGAGTVAIGLPFIDAMHTRTVWGGGAEPPVRAFNLFFGLGIPGPLQQEGFAGPIEPLAEFADKLLVVRGVNHLRADIPGDNAHFDGATSSFNAAPSGGEVAAGGPTIDQVLRSEFYPEPQGQPDGVIPTLLAGTWFRRSRPGRFIHSWNLDGSPADLPFERPVALFERIFGSMPDPGKGEDQEKRLRQKRSILDSVVPQYEHMMSDASNLGSASRSRISDHLENIREHERRVFGEGPDCDPPTTPAASAIPHEAAADPDGSGIDITLDALVGEWRLMCDLYALAVQCDLVRFGGLTYMAAGERIRLTGDYDYNGGQFTHQFDDLGIRGVSGSAGCAHEYWHEFQDAGENIQMRAHIHLMMREIAYMLGKFDDPMYADANGGTILDNALVSISTESGDGRHSPVDRELSTIFHAFSGAGGRVRTNEIVDANAEGLDVYNTILRDGYNLEAKMGPADREYNPVGAVLPGG